MKWILGLSRYPVFQPQNTPNTRKQIFEMPRSPNVATCRQTVDALLAPLPPLGSGWLRFGSRRFAIPGRSHLSPDGGGPYSPRFHRLAADGYDSTADDSPSPDVATCRQTVEALLATHHRLAADGYDSKADDSRSPAVATCRQTAEALLAPLSTDWQRMATGNDPKEKGLLLPTPLSR